MKTINCTKKVEVNSNPQVYCRNDSDDEENGILFKTKPFDIINGKKKKRTRRKTSTKNKQIGKINVELEEEEELLCIEPIEKTRKKRASISSENGIIKEDVNYNLQTTNEFEDFYLYNLESPTFKERNINSQKKSFNYKYLISISKSEKIQNKKTELLLYGYLRNIQINLKDCIPQNIAKKIENSYINEYNTKFNNIDISGGNGIEDQFVKNSSFTINDKQFAQKLLDKELGLSLNNNNNNNNNHCFNYEYSLTASPSTSSIISTSYCAYNNNNNNIYRRSPNYSTMKIEKILEFKLSIRELVSLNLIIRLMRDQYGSRYLQNKLKSHTTSECYSIITFLINYLISLKIDLISMSEDIYGNYLIQLFFARGNDIHHELLFNYFIYKSTLRLCKSKYGCRVIQKILTCVKNRCRLIELVDYFKEQSLINNDIHECLLCCNTNHVIQAMIELKLPFKTMIFLKDTLESNLVCYSENVYACRVVQSFIKVYADKININKLCENNSHLFLSQVKYGNYVIQCIIKKNEWYSNLSEINKFRNQLIDDVFTDSNILYLSKDKHGSNVIETCIRVSNEKQIDKLINTICSNKAFLLKQLICDKFGNYIPKTLLKFCNTKKQIRILINTIHSYITNLYQYNHPYPHCSEFITKCEKIKYDMDKQYQQQRSKNRYYW